MEKAIEDLGDQFKQKSDPICQELLPKAKDLTDKNVNSKISDTEDTDDSMGSYTDDPRMDFFSSGSSGSNASLSDSDPNRTAGSGVFPRLRRLSCYDKPEIQNKMTFVENSSESSTSEESVSGSDDSIEFETSSGSETSYAKYSGSDENSESVTPRSESETGNWPSDSDSDDIEYVPSSKVSRPEIRRSRSDSSAYTIQPIDAEMAETDRNVNVVKEETFTGKMQRVAKKTAVYSSAAFSVGLGSWTIRYSLQCQSGCKFDCFDMSAFEKLLELRHL